MAARKITDDILDQIATLDLMGYSLAESAEKLGLGRETIRRHRAKIREQRQEYRNVKESAFIHQYDLLRRGSVARLH